MAHRNAVLGWTRTAPGRLVAVSISLMSEVWEADLPRDQKIVLLAMADHAQDDGSRVFPGVERLAQKCGYSERSVRRKIADLKDEGLLEPVAYEEGGRGHATEFNIHAENLDKLSYFTEKGDSGDENPDTGDDKPGQSLSPQPSVTVSEPSSSAREGSPTREEHSGARQHRVPNVRR